MTLIRPFWEAVLSKPKGGRKTYFLFLLYKSFTKEFKFANLKKRRIIRGR
jgi:hypothetical protein